jgi:hypothetical protein
MVPLLSEFWRFVQYLLRPEDHSAGAQYQPPPVDAPMASALAGVVKTLFWACLALLAGLGLGRLGG